MKEVDGLTLPDLRRLIASLPLAVVALAPEQKIALANPAAEQFFGQSLRRRHPVRRRRCLGADRGGV